MLCILFRQGEKLGQDKEGGSKKKNYTAIEIIKSDGHSSLIQFEKQKWRRMNVLKMLGRGSQWDMVEMGFGGDKGTDENESTLLTFIQKSERQNISNCNINGPFDMILSFNSYKNPKRFIIVISILQMRKST